MQFQVQLYLREHRNGFFSLEVLGEPGLCAYAEDLDAAREELELILHDRLERLHPSLLSRYATSNKLQLELIDLPAGVEREGALGPEGAHTQAAALIVRERKWARVWLPRWDLRHWIPLQDDLQEVIRGHVEEYIRKLSPSNRLALRFERREWIETLTIDAEPAPLARFTGALRGASALPEPTVKVNPEAEDEDPDEDEPEEGVEPPKKQKGKKKRPPTPTLKRIGVPLSARAADQDLERAHGRRRELEELLGLLQAPSGGAMVVLGDTGVGKTTLLYELVYRLRDKRTPKKLRERPVFFADASRLIAGDGWFGDWQRQCLDVVQECIDAEVIWYIGNPLALLDAGKSISSDQNVALLLKPFLAGRRLTVLAECSTRAWAQVELRDAGFARLFSPYRLEEPAPQEGREILQAVARELARDTAVEVRPDGLRAIEDLSLRFRGDGSRLGTAIHFLRRLVDEASIRLDRDPDASSASLGRAEAIARFCEETGMPPFLVRDDQPMDPEAVVQHFHRHIIGQSEAVRRMTDLVSLMKAGLSDLHKPLGSFLFVGPTGVGKTEMAKALTGFLFGRRDRMIRFDMSEFISPLSVHRFLGDEGQEGALIAQVRRSPFCVLLLDEIEKAHPAVFDVLLQVLGEARLTDQAGRVADFRNTVVLMTSNLGVETWKGGVGFNAGAAASFREHFLAEAERFFRPEFFNRIDHIVPFVPLEAPAIDRITARELSHFLAREGIRQREVTVTLDPDVHHWIAQRGVEPRYGARPLKRLIERRLTAPLARHFSGQRPSPGRVILVKPDGDELAFENHESAQRAARASIKARLLRFLEDLGELRAQITRWTQSFPFRELVQDLRLLDRLSQDRNFWRDQRRAEARMRHSQASRDLQHAFEALRDQVASVEDLAYEAYYDRRDEPLELLAPELDQAIARLDALELELFARRFQRPDIALLYFQGSQSSQSFLNDFMHIYVALAEQHGWSLGLRFAKESEESVAARAARRAQKAERNPNARAAKDKKSDDRLAWSWTLADTLHPRRPDEEDGAWFERRNQFVGKATQVPTRLASLRVEGPRAPCLLFAESGVHARHDHGENMFIKVAFQDVGEGEPQNPVDVMERWATHTCRLTHVGRRVVEDVALKISLPIEPRLHRVYERMMRAHMYDEVFGKGAYKRFDRRNLGGASS